MDKALVVVESPTKIKTLKKYLGNKYNIAATVGHIKDLPVKEIGIDIEKGFKPKYQNIPGKQKVIQALRRAAGDAADVYLAPDPDREGEAIAWHTADVLKAKGRKFHRVLFHELTKSAVLKAIHSPAELHLNRYKAQQTRRTLDRLVGYEISPLLWRKVKRGLSAGRVQSVAVRIICDRERAIQAFEPEEYWTITAGLSAESPPPFRAKLVKKNGKKIKITDEKTAMGIYNQLNNETFIIDKIVKKITRRNPLPPFITSKLQQEAIRKLRFSAKKAMVVAQQLYEGIELGPRGSVGLITYMRTDSTRIAEEAAKEAQTLIRTRFGEKYILDKQRVFKNRKKAQDAHEAIRPTSVFNLPEKISPYLNKDQMSLYNLIWKRFVASQMQQALINRNTIAIKVGDYGFSASGSSVKFPGFMALYMSADDQITLDKEKKDILPETTKGMILKTNQLIPKQHFTTPPPRFSEASLVKELEENGIGRPSTYANILSTIRGKGYVAFERGYFNPTELGFIVNDLIVASFPDEFDVDFTAKMEDNLDRVESAELNAEKILSDFYESFKKRLEIAAGEMLSMKSIGFETELECPKCKIRKLHIKIGKNGSFLACNGYPACHFSSNYIRGEKGNIEIVVQEPDKPSDVDCDKCGNPMVIKQGRYGKFLACSAYPKCKNTRSVNGSNGTNTTGVDCPEPKCDGKILERRSKRGKVFYGCSRYPDCAFATWNKPVNQVCSQCGGKYLVEKSTKKTGKFLACQTAGCGHKEIIPD